MSLPDGFLDELRTRLSIAQVVGRKVMWDTRKSNQAKGDMWAPCPFHQEKTASFHVEDRKGFYYCFGCHAKGDAISFVRETENVGFMEAVEILAREAGMAMPAQDPKAQERADHRTELTQVMDAAVRFFQLQLKTAAGAKARAYLAGRGLDDVAIERWEIGFAPDLRQGVYRHLTGKGAAAQQVIDAGLAAKPDDGGEPFDRFRGRIIFPIRDARGRAIALGGRALDPNARAKYLNSPETALFDKGRSLYNHGPAREAAGKGQPLVVAEGYMDVIALARAGFTATVAPLGTAITEDQLTLLGRIDPEPVIALDGDKAGLRAAMRLVDLALPLLEAGQSLRFAVLPEGRDPDDLLKAEGPKGMQAVLDGSLPMVQLLWRRETEGKSFDSPERRAALDKVLRTAINTIKDGSIKRHYGEEIAALRRTLFNGHHAIRLRRGGRDEAAQIRATTRASLLARASEEVEDSLREAVVLAGLVSNPSLIDAFEDRLEALECRQAEHDAVRRALLRHRTRDAITHEVGVGTLEKLFAPRHVQISPPVRDPTNNEMASQSIAEELEKLLTRRGAVREIEEAVQDMGDIDDEGLTWRLGEAARARDPVSPPATTSGGEFDLAPNGSRLDRSEREAFDRVLKETGLSNKDSAAQSDTIVKK